MQKHDALRAGTHHDIRLVVGNKAYSWATKKDIPEPGKSIVLHEQPVHTAEYALTEHLEIPKGNYGAGVTNLLFVRKARLEKGEGKDHFILHSGKEKFLLKHVPEYGPKQWLFRNLTGLEKSAGELSHKTDSKYTFVTGYAGSGKSTAYPNAITLDRYLKKLLISRGGNGSIENVKTDGIEALLENHPEGAVFEGAQVPRLDREELLKHNIKVIDTGIVRSSFRTVKRSMEPSHIKEWGFNPLHNVKYNLKMRKALNSLKQDIEKSAMLITQYQNDETGATVWVPENKPVPEKHSKTGKQIYKRKKMSNKYLEKIASMAKEAGLPITPANIGKVALTNARKATEFASRASSGKVGVKDFRKYLDSTARLEANAHPSLLPKIRQTQKVYQEMRV